MLGVARSEPSRGSLPERYAAPQPARAVANSMAAAMALRALPPHSECVDAIVGSGKARTETRYQDDIPRC
jgi:hypothetical protein